MWRKSHTTGGKWLMCPLSLLAGFYLFFFLSICCVCKNTDTILHWSLCTRRFQERTKAFGDGIRSLEEREDKMARELGGKHIAVGKSEEEATKQGQLWKKLQKKKKKKEKEEKKKKRRKEKEEAKKYRRAKKEMKKEERAKWKARQAKAENSPQDKKKTAAAAEL